MKLKSLLGATVALGVLGVFGGGAAQASSHSDAPLIKLDPQVNLTDVYAFISQAPNNGPKSLVIEVSVRPFSEPGDGVLYDAFSDDARYSISIANPSTGAELQRYDFQFSPVSSGQGSYKNLNTILRYGRGTEIGAIQDVGDARQNFVQTYSVTRVAGGASTPLSGTPLMVPPYNSGVNATPFYNDMAKTLAGGGANPNYGRAVSGAASRAALDRYTRESTYDLSGGQTVFAGSREDGFYADTPGIFDLLDSRILSSAKGFGLGQDGTGVDGFKGFNTLHYGIVIPLSQLPASTQYTGLALTAQGAVTTTTQTGIGVFASVARPRTTLRSIGGDNTSSGPYIQVNREANPLFNEVLVALKDKDNYNRDVPTNDATRYKTYAQNPEVAVLINATYGTKFATTGRDDLALVYIPDVIRVETTTGSARLSGQTGYSRLGAFGGDGLVNSAGATIPGGWPNGRRFGDDVVDIALTAVASGPSFSPITLLGDNINSNDQTYNMTFPYAATPNAGTRNSKDSGPNVGG